ncbi:RNA/RNP complex-1-interacting phosphatase-like, partial [Menidia menidia]
MSGHHQKRNGVPDRWLDYSAVGRRLDGTRFLAFKVPLKQALNQHLGGAGFGPRELLQAVGRQNQELGLIIDLTFTSRYYGLQDLPDSLQRLKILTAGRQVPADATILSFKRAVHRFLTENQHNDKLIGVHCTHGLNRTGYLICRYLIDVDGMEPERAVQLFNSSRGHAIERENYLEDLLLGPKRSNAGIEELEELPQWGGAAPRGGWEEGGPPHHPPPSPPPSPPPPPPPARIPQVLPSTRTPLPPPAAPAPPPPLPVHPRPPGVPMEEAPPPPGGQEEAPPPGGQEEAPPPPGQEAPPPPGGQEAPPPTRRTGGGPPPTRRTGG